VLARRRADPSGKIMRSRVWGFAVAIVAGCAASCGGVLRKSLGRLHLPVRISRPAWARYALPGLLVLADAVAAADPAAADTSAYYAALKQAVAAKVIYPPQALVAGEQGVCRVKATFLRSGAVVESTLVQSAGYADLDQECVAVFGRISKLPAAPASLSPASPRLMLEIPVTFSLAAGG
jgi:TonB family protein